jgi:hypothetical protein
MVKRRKYMSRRRLAIKKHFKYKPDLKKLAARRRAKHKRMQRKKKRKRREAKAKRLRGLGRKKLGKRKKKVSHARQLSRHFKFSRYYKGRNRIFYQNINSLRVFGL